MVIKKTFFNELCNYKQEILKTLNLSLFRRVIILRDVKGPIDHFNLNYHPIHSRSLQKIIDKIRSNFYIQEVTRNQSSNCCSLFKKSFNSSLLVLLSKYLRNKDLNLALISERLNNNVRKNIKGLNCIYKVNLNKKFPYQIFREKIIENLNMPDQMSLLNEVLFNVYYCLDDKEIKYLVENPIILLNFIINDTGLFYKNNDENSIMEIIKNQILNDSSKQMDESNIKIKFKIGKIKKLLANKKKRLCSSVDIKNSDLSIYKGSKEYKNIFLRSYSLKEHHNDTHLNYLKEIESLSYKHISKIKNSNFSLIDSNADSKIISSSIDNENINNLNFLIDISRAKSSNENESIHNIKTELTSVKNNELEKKNLACNNNIENIKTNFKNNCFYNSDNLNLLSNKFQVFANSSNKIVNHNISNQYNKDKSITSVKNLSSSSIQTFNNKSPKFLSHNNSIQESPSRNDKRNKENLQRLLINSCNKIDNNDHLWRSPKNSELIHNLETISISNQANSTGNDQKELKKNISNSKASLTTNPDSIQKSNSKKEINTNQKDKKISSNQSNLENKNVYLSYNEINGQNRAIEDEYNSLNINAISNFKSNLSFIDEKLKQKRSQLVTEFNPLIKRDLTASNKKSNKNFLNEVYSDAIEVKKMDGVGIPLTERKKIGQPERLKNFVLEPFDNINNSRQSDKNKFNDDQFQTQATSYQYESDYLNESKNKGKNKKEKLNSLYDLGNFTRKINLSGIKDKSNFKVDTILKEDKSLKGKIKDHKYNKKTDVINISIHTNSSEKLNIDSGLNTIYTENNNKKNILNENYIANNMIKMKCSIIDTNKKDDLLINSQNTDKILFYDFTLKNPIFIENNEDLDNHNILEKLSEDESFFSEKHLKNLKNNSKFEDKTKFNEESMRTPMDENKSTNYKINNASFKQNSIENNNFSIKNKLLSEIKNQDKNSDEQIKLGCNSLKNKKNSKIIHDNKRNVKSIKIEWFDYHSHNKKTNFNRMKVNKSSNNELKNQVTRENETIIKQPVDKQANFTYKSPQNYKFRKSKSDLKNISKPIKATKQNIIEKPSKNNKKNLYNSNQDSQKTINSYFNSKNNNKTSIEKKNYNTNLKELATRVNIDQVVNCYSERSILDESSNITGNTNYNLRNKNDQVKSINTDKKDMIKNDKIESENVKSINHLVKNDVLELKKKTSEKNKLEHNYQYKFEISNVKLDDLNVHFSPEDDLKNIKILTDTIDSNFNSSILSKQYENQNKNNKIKLDNDINKEEEIKKIENIQNLIDEKDTRIKTDSINKQIVQIDNSYSTNLKNNTNTENQSSFNLNSIENKNIIDSSSTIDNKIDVQIEDSNEKKRNSNIKLSEESHIKNNLICSKEVDNINFTSFITKISINSKEKNIESTNNQLENTIKYKNKIKSPSLAEIINFIPTYQNNDYIQTNLDINERKLISDSNSYNIVSEESRKSKFSNIKEINQAQSTSLKKVAEYEKMSFENNNKESKSKLNVKNQNSNDLTEKKIKKRISINGITNQIDNLHSNNYEQPIINILNDKKFIDKLSVQGLRRTSSLENLNLFKNNKVDIKLNTKNPIKSQRTIATIPTYFSSNAKERIKTQESKSSNHEGNKKKIITEKSEINKKLLKKSNTKNFINPITNFSKSSIKEKECMKKQNFKGFNNQILEDNSFKQSKYNSNDNNSSVIRKLSINNIEHTKETSPLKKFNTITIEEGSNFLDNLLRRKTSNYIQKEKSLIIQNIVRKNTIKDNVSLSPAVGENQCNPDVLSVSELPAKKCIPVLQNVTNNLKQSQLSREINQELTGVPAIPVFQTLPRVPIRPGIAVTPGMIGISKKDPELIQPEISGNLEGFSQKEKIKSKSNMKQLYWNIIDPKKIKNTAWGMVLYYN